MTQNTETYVRYTQPNAKGDIQTFVSEENSFEKFSAKPENENIEEDARQSYLIPIIQSDNDLFTLIPDDRLRLDFLQKAVDSKVALRINREMKAKDFTPTEGAIDTTPWLNEESQRPRLSDEAKFQRFAEKMFANLSPEQRKAKMEAFLEAMLLEQQA